MKLRVLAGLCALVLSPSVAQAAEVRLGAGPSGHDLVVQVDDEGQEQGASVAADVVFDKAEALSWLGSPRPYIGAVVSLDDYTSFAQAGALWRAEGERFYGEAGLGLAIHDGELHLPRPDPSLSAAENARRLRDLQTRNQFGSRVLLHVTLAVGYRVTDKLAMELGTQHWSQGGAVSKDNDGADILFLRGAYRFGAP